MNASVHLLLPRKNPGYEAAMQACERELAHRKREKHRNCHRLRTRVHAWWFVGGITLLLALVFVLLQGSYPKLGPHDCLIFATGAMFSFAAYHLYKVDWHHRRIK